MSSTFAGEAIKALSVLSSFYLPVLLTWSGWLMDALWDGKHSKYFGWRLMLRIVMFVSTFHAWFFSLSLRALDWDGSVDLLWASPWQGEWFEELESIKKSTQWWEKGKETGHERVCGCIVSKCKQSQMVEIKPGWEHFQWTAV